MNKDKGNDKMWDDLFYAELNRLTKGDEKATGEKLTDEYGEALRLLIEATKNGTHRPTLQDIVDMSKNKKVDN